MVILTHLRYLALAQALLLLVFVALTAYRGFHFWWLVAACTPFLLIALAAGLMLLVLVLMGYSEG